MMKFEKPDYFFLLPFIYRYTSWGMKTRHEEYYYVHYEFEWLWFKITTMKQINKQKWKKLKGKKILL